MTAVLPDTGLLEHLDFDHAAECDFGSDTKPRPFCRRSPVKYRLAVPCEHTILLCGVHGAWWRRHLSRFPSSWVAAYCGVCGRNALTCEVRVVPLCG